MKQLFFLFPIFKQPTVLHIKQNQRDPFFSPSSCSLQGQLHPKPIHIKKLLIFIICEVWKVQKKYVIVPYPQRVHSEFEGTGHIYSHNSRAVQHSCVVPVSLSSSNFMKIMCCFMLSCHCSCYFSLEYNLFLPYIFQVSVKSFLP